MGITVVGFLLAVSLLALSLNAAGHPLCIDSRSPSQPVTALSFCSQPAYSTFGCCSTARDAQLQSLFSSYNITNQACAAVLKKGLCAECDPYAAQVFGYEDKTPQSFPFLCYSNSSTSTSFCTQVYEACANVSIPNSLLSQSPTPQPTRISDIFPFQSAFCNAFGKNASLGYCYDGNAVTVPDPGTFITTGGLCFDKVANGTYINMSPMPGDSTGKVFLASQFGKIQLVTMPADGSMTSANSSGPTFLDLSRRVIPDGEMGLLGLALHPNYTQNGRFFVAYSCNSTLYADCLAPCACDGTTCDPNQLPGGRCSGVSTVIAEYTAPSPLTGPANANETRRILTFGKPYENHNGGQLLFGPDGFLYFMSGDGGSDGDPWNFAQATTTLLGKILRLNVDANLTTVGYGIPPDNPFVNQTGRPEIFALGFRNPWRCTFDRLRPTYMFCGDVGQASTEEVSLVTKGGNYGWRIVEGDAPYIPAAGAAPGGSTPIAAVNLTPPVLVYKHENPRKPSSVTGGFVYRGTRDQCQYGRYIYADLYGTIYSAQELPLNSGNFSTSQVAAKCSGASSPISCGAKGDTPNFQFIFSFGEDNAGDLYLLALGGVYRLTSPDKCGIPCVPGQSVVTSPIGAPVAAPSAPLASGNSTSAGTQLSVALVKVAVGLLLLAMCC